MKKENFIQITLIFLFLIGVISTFAFSDTGTYKILDYRVNLTPHSDGMVEIEYYQKWLVTGGHIPWITIGTANSAYQIDQSKNTGNIRSIYAYNSAGWSGVRIDLDKDYLPDETFEVGFCLTQSHLFYVEGDNFRLDFTPGWYDRAVIEKLTLSMHVFAPIDKVTTYPNPGKIEGEDIVWEKLSLNQGEHYDISIFFPRTYLPNISNKAFKWGKSPTRILISNIIDWLFILFVCGIVIYVIVKIVLASRRYGKGGSLNVAGSGGSSAGRSGRSTGGGGGFGGRSSSCACACVSCACACACAGGGGAGCSKKIHHTCSFCSGEERPPRQHASKYNT
jgi:uncharacterized membrane protein YgcG